MKQIRSFFSQFAAFLRIPNRSRLIPWDKAFRIPWSLMTAGSSWRISVVATITFSIPNLEIPIEIKRRRAITEGTRGNTWAWPNNSYSPFSSSKFRMSRKYPRDLLSRMNGPTPKMTPKTTLKKLTQVKENTASAQTGTAWKTHLILLTPLRKMICLIKCSRISNKGIRLSE